MTPNVGPFVPQHTIDDSVTRRTIPPGAMMAYDTILLRAKPFDRPLRREIEIISPEPYDLTTKPVESVLEKQPLARRVYVRPLPPPGVEGVSDLHAIDVRHDVVISRAADDGTRIQLTNGPRQHVSGLLAGQRGCDIGRHAGRLGHGRVPQFPEATVSYGGLESLEMIRRQRLQPYAVALE